VKSAKIIHILRGQYEMQATSSTWHMGVYIVSVSGQYNAGQVHRTIAIISAVLLRDGVIDIPHECVSACSRINSCNIGIRPRVLARSIGHSRWPVYSRSKARHNIYCVKTVVSIVVKGPKCGRSHKRKLQKEKRSSCVDHIGHNVRTQLNNGL
jgi:hypothetical protein